MEANDSLRVASFSCYLSNPEESFVKKLGEDPYPNAFSPPTTKDNLANLRVESFSSYLGEDNFAFKALGAAPVQDPAIAFVFPQQASAATPKHQYMSKSKDGELGIFGADKYFNMRLNYGAVPTKQMKASSRTATPSICSEASSFNSQTALIQNLETNKTKQKKMTGRRFFASFGCQPCLDKKAVYVDKHGIPKPGSNHEVALTSVPVVKKHLNNQDQSIEEQRKSIEVFGSHKMRKGDVATNLERKLSMLTWDAIPKAQSTTSSTVICDDMASDASSDLFEIDNISSSGGGYGVLLNSQTGDDYAPSEASIEWSVMTASAADYSSVISDYDQKNIVFSSDTISRNKNTKTKNTTDKGGLLGCTSHKAVSVVETVHMTAEKVKHHQRG